MTGEIVFDIETYGDIRRFDDLKVTVVSIYDYDSDSYRSFEESELKNLWPIFERATRLVGFNTEHFDLPILDKYYAGNLMAFPSLDLLRVIKDTTGSRFKLNDLAKATLNIEKSADGLEAMRWYEEGKMDEIKKYCEQDVKVTKELYEYGLANQTLFIKNLVGELVNVPVDFSAGPDKKPKLNLTLPF